MKSQDLPSSSPLSVLSESLFERYEETTTFSRAPSQGPENAQTPPPASPQPSTQPSPTGPSREVNSTQVPPQTPTSARTRARSARQSSRQATPQTPAMAPRSETARQSSKQPSGRSTRSTGSTPAPGPAPKPEQTPEAEPEPTTPQDAPSPARPPPKATPQKAATGTPATGRKRKAPLSTGGSSSAPKIVLAKKRRNGAAAAKWAVPAVFTDPKSPLVRLDLRDILLHPKAWEGLSAEERAGLAGLTGEGEGAAAGPDPSHLRSDDSFRFDCTRYLEGIEGEQYDDGWLREAWVAHRRRRRGEFAGYLAGKLERNWGARVEEGEEDEGQDGRGEGRDRDGDVKMEDGGGEAQRSRETSGSHSIVSSVGEGKFTRLRLGLREDEDAAEEETVEDEIVVG